MACHGMRVVSCRVESSHELRLHSLHHAGGDEQRVGRAEGLSGSLSYAGCVALSLSYPDAARPLPTSVAGSAASSARVMYALCVDAASASPSAVVRTSRCDVRHITDCTDMGILI